jgi:hypothetical protein
MDSKNIRTFRLKHVVLMPFGTFRNVLRECTAIARIIAFFDKFPIEHNSASTEDSRECFGEKLATRAAARIFEIDHCDAMNSRRAQEISDAFGTCAIAHNCKV